MPTKSAIILAAFGSLQPSAFTTYENIKRSYEQKYSDSEVRIAFTSDFIRRRLKVESISIQNPLMALSELQDQGFADIVVQPLQIVPGKEFHEIASLVQCLKAIHGRQGFHKIALGMPLLGSIDDCKKAASTLKPIFEEMIPANGQEDRDETDIDGMAIDGTAIDEMAIVLVGHGTGHPADSLYSQMALILESSFKNVFLGTLEGYPGLGDVLSLLNENQIKRAVIMPFLLVAGGHALEDIAGAGQSSWRTILEDKGFDVDVRQRGLGDEEGIIKLFLEHTSDAMKKDFIPGRS